jgi:hypothetical protein
MHGILLKADVNMCNHVGNASANELCHVKWHEIKYDVPKTISHSRNYFIRI